MTCAGVIISDGPPMHPIVGYVVVPWIVPALCHLHGKSPICGCYLGAAATTGTETVLLHLLDAIHHHCHMIFDILVPCFRCLGLSLGLGGERRDGIDRILIDGCIG